MKKIIISIVVFSVLAASCTKVLDSLTTFTFSRTTTFTIPGSTGLGIPVNLNTPDVVTNYETEFSTNNANADKIEYIKLTDMNLAVSSPANGNLDFLKSIQLSISADGLSDIVIASKNDVADGLSILELDVQDEDLKPYLIKDTYKLKVEAVTDQLITQDYDFSTTSTFEVKANLR
jgi:hypothetical protein